LPENRNFSARRPPPPATGFPRAGKTGGAGVSSRSDFGPPAGPDRAVHPRGPAMPSSLPVINQSEAKFECIFGRGCDGICCQNGRPFVWPEEADRIAGHLDKFLPHLRPEARALIEREGFLGNRRKQGHPMIRVQGGWCVFFKDGCVLHKVGAAEG